MKEYYDKKKKEAVCTLTDILGYQVENTRGGVTAALALALRDGTARIAAIADRSANLWFWADAETDEEDYKSKMAPAKEDCVHDDTGANHAEGSHDEGHVEETAPEAIAPAAPAAPVEPAVQASEAKPAVARPVVA